MPYSPERYSRLPTARRRRQSTSSAAIAEATRLHAAARAHGAYELNFGIGPLAKDAAYKFRLRLYAVRSFWKAADTPIWETARFVSIPLAQNEKDEWILTLLNRAGGGNPV